MVALLESTLGSAIVTVLLFSLLPSIEARFPVTWSLGGFHFFVTGVFSPVDLLLFFPFNPVIGLDVGGKALSVLLGRVVGDCPISTVNWLIWGCSSGFISLIFLPLLDADMIRTAGVVIICLLHFGTPVNTVVRLVMFYGMPDNYGSKCLPFCTCFFLVGDLC